MKTCPRCKTKKSLDEFSWHKSKGYQAFCKPCNREYKREWYQANKIHVRTETKNRKERNISFVLDFLEDHPCVDCGETDIVVLEFDHLENKYGTVTGLAKLGISLENLIKEIEKCEVVCANCHKRRTNKRCNSRRYQRAPVV